MADRVLPDRASQFVLAIVFDIIGSGGACPASVSVRLANWTSGGGDRPSLKLLYGCRDAGGLDLLNSGGNAVNVTIKAQPGLRRSEVPGPYLRSIRFEPESKHKIVIADVSFDPFTYEPDEAISQVQFRQLSPGQTLLILDRRVLANCTHSLAWAAMVRKRDSAIAEIDSNSDSCRLATLPDGSVGRLIVSGECGSEAKASKVSAYLAVQFNNWRSPPLTDKLGRYFRFFTWSDMSLASVEREGPQAALPGPEFEQNRMRIASQLAFRLSLTNSSSGRSSYPGNYTIELRPVRTDFLYGAVIENCRLEDADTGELLAELVAKGCTLPNSNWLGSPGFYRNRLLIRLAEFKHRSLIARCQFNPCYLVRPELTGLPAQLISQFGISDCGLVSKPCGRAHYLPLFDAVSQPLFPPSLPTVPALLQTSSPVQQVQQPPPHSQRCTPPQASSATPHYPLWSHALAALVSYALGLATLAAIWLILRRPWRRRRRRRRRQSATAIGGGGSHQVTTIAAIDVGVSGGNGLAHPRQHQQQRLALTRCGGAVEGYRHRANETNGNCVHGFGDGNKTDSAKPLLGAPAPAGSNATAGSSSANCDLAGQEGELESDECHCRSTSGSNGASGSGGSSAPLSAVAAADRNSHCGAALFPVMSPPLMQFLLLLLLLLHSAREANAQPDFGRYLTSNSVASLSALTAVRPRTRTGKLSTESVKEQIRSLYMNMDVPEIAPLGDSVDGLLNVSLEIGRVLRFANQANPGHVHHPGAALAQLRWRHRFLKMLQEDLQSVPLNRQNLWTPRMAFVNALSMEEDQNSLYLHLAPGDRAVIYRLWYRASVRCDSSSIRHPLGDQLCALVFEDTHPQSRRSIRVSPSDRHRLKCSEVRGGQHPLVY
uniref:ZP domain-containing protein n=1 Tax=Macrostomum lignano TaxID=282301 RepID=A0A1I8HIK5_9PLAT